MVVKIATIFIAVIAAPFILKFTGVGVIVCSFIFILIGYIYWKLRHRIPENNVDDSISIRTRRARRAINTGMLDADAAKKKYGITKKDMRNQKYHDELFW